MNLLSIKTRTLLLFLISGGGFYLAFTTTFSSFFMNIALFIIAIFVLLQGCANVDRMNGILPPNVSKNYHPQSQNNDNNDVTK